MSFQDEIIAGLKSQPKKLSSKFFYDEKGDVLFQEIMKLPEYYLTKCEYEIFENEKDALLQLFSEDAPEFDLVELGAGDGFKTKILLEHFIYKGKKFHYLPIDISCHVLTELEKELKSRFNGSLSVKCQCDEYFAAVEKINKSTDTKKVILFLGANIGNFDRETAVSFLTALRDHMTHYDKLVIGFDLKKDPTLIINAYNDSKGVTKAFNYNLLDRINEEMSADFMKENFKHFPVYNPVSGEAKSYLISLKNQVVHFKKTGDTIHFDYAEAIDMETSQKYDIRGIHQLAEKCGFKVRKDFFDCKQYFVDSVWMLDE